MTDADRFYAWVNARMQGCNTPVDLKKLYDEFKRLEKPAPAVGVQDAGNVGYTHVSEKPQSTLT